MGLFKEFRAFAVKGNVIDLAIGVVIGAAFGKIVSSLVDDIITPSVLTPVLTAARLSDLDELVIPGTAIKYGNFISTLLSFFIIAFVLFIVVKSVNRTRSRMDHAQAQEAPGLTLSEKLLTEIRDNLKK